MTPPRPSEPSELVELRALIRQTLRDVLPEVAAAAGSTEAVAQPATDDDGRPSGVAVDQAVPGASVEAVTVRTDADLQQLVARLLALADNPKHRADLRTGRLQFRLAVPAGPAGSAPTLRYVEKGAVTEGQVKDAARAGVGLRLGRRAVLTPLARDKARALGVLVEREA
jgi:hypothetical protein